eukprot:scaffold1307_cov200-Pinguiococcus_pyrenoidosus.AAC.117
MRLETGFTTGLVLESPPETNTALPSALPQAACKKRLESCSPPRFSLVQAMENESPPLSFKTCPTKASQKTVVPSRPP